MPTPEAKEDFACLHVHRKALGGSERAPLKISVDVHPQTSTVGFAIAQRCTHVLGTVLRPGRCEEKKQDNWPKVNQHLEGLSYIRDLSHLFTSRLLIREHVHALSFWVCISALILS